MVTPVRSVSAVSLKYEAADDPGGQEHRDQDEERAEAREYESDDAAHRPSGVCRLPRVGAATFALDSREIQTHYCNTFYF
jgi:hypothetical protein